MSASQDTISKVKDILRRMDQSIDSARSRRLAGRPTPPSPAAPLPSSAIQQNAQQPGVAPAGSPPLRAKPLPRVQNFAHPAFP